MSTHEAVRARHQVNLISRMCDFIETPSIREAVEKSVPCTMPQTPGGLGLDVPLWVGLGIVGIWAALDAFAERAFKPGKKCPTCGGRCIVAKFKVHLTTKRIRVLEELEDLRHLYAHNFAGEPDAVYFKRTRHVLTAPGPVLFSCGVNFDGQRVALDFGHMGWYCKEIAALLEKL